MSRDHHWRWRSFLPDAEEDRAPADIQDNARIHERGAFVEHPVPGIGPSPDSRLMRPVPPRVVRPRTRRPDVRVMEDVCEAMAHDGWLDASDIEVAVRDGEVTLTGEVDDREQKWRAEDHAEHALGVTAVVNRIRVRRRRDEDLEPKSRRQPGENGHARR